MIYNVDNIKAFGETAGREVLIIGSGASAYASALRLFRFGKTDIALITDGIYRGTSRNAGSDKQTYYKLSLCGANPDSVADMAKTLFDGGAVNGDTAYAEAACSARCFITLAELGVPFPTNELGEFIGYKTDNDPKRRGTSAGPLTSKYMTECLEREVIRNNIDIFDGFTAVKLAVEDGRVYGVICLDSAGNPVAFSASYVILATGGPSGVYDDVVYPVEHCGMSGLAIEASAECSNLSEWQYGLASVKFRWNLSGSYQQVIPRYYSVGDDGEEIEFLRNSYTDGEEFGDIFLKGYQWPFSSDKLHASSRIDALVSEERGKGRKVFMDFRRNPTGFSLSSLPPEAYEYLRNSSALGVTPIKRLEAMNPKAITLYKEHNIDLYNEPLEISLSAQHCNGGISVDADWQSSVKGLYVVGEAAGTFGIARPGGSALNSGQVGALRAAFHIAYKAPDESSPIIFDGGLQVKRALENVRELISKFSRNAVKNPAYNSESERRLACRNMTRYASAMRYPGEFARLENDIKTKLASFSDTAGVKYPSDYVKLFRLRDIYYTQLAMLSAMRCCSESCGSRGSAVYIENGDIIPEKPETRKYVLVTALAGENFKSSLREVRPLPEPDLWFERVWKKYNKITERMNDNG